MHEIAAKQESGALSSTVKPVKEPPLLVVLCGPSHVGKTSFAQRIGALGENFTIISPDEIRERLSVRYGDPEHESKVWDIYEDMKCKALKQGRNVILDACHMSKRARCHSLQSVNANYRKICVVFDLPFRTVQRRCLKEKRVSLKEVERMWRDFQKNKPTTEELRQLGFDEIYFLKECPIRTAERVPKQHSNTSSSIADCDCRCAPMICVIFHYLLARLLIWPEGAWYNDEGVSYG